MTIDAPLLTVVGGSTGAGKSTLVNSLVGTRSPSPACSARPPARRCWCTTPPTPSGSARTGCCPTSSASTRSTDRPGRPAAGADARPCPPGLAILDAPDIDSVEERNRTLAAQLLAAADLWLFVTSAARYADQVPWDFLQQAAERSTAVAIVLDRTPVGRGRDRLHPPGPDAGQPRPQGLAAVHGHRGARSTTTGCCRRPRSPTSAAGSSRWPPTPRPAPAVVKQTLEGAVRTVARRTHSIADAAGEQERPRSSGCARTPTRPTTTRWPTIEKASADGTLLRGEVLARWQEFVGTGELLRSLETRVGWLRDRVVNAIKGKPQQAERVTVAVESGLETLLLEHAEAAAERAEASWQSLAPGPGPARRRRRGPRPGLARLPPARPSARCASGSRACSTWSAPRAPTSASTARFLAFGVNGLSVALMVVVFAHTAGVTGAEVGIAGGSAVLGQKLLEAVFGDQAVRSLAERAQPRPRRARRTSCCDAERARYTDLLDGARDHARHRRDRLRDAARRVDDLRFAAQRIGRGAASHAHRLVHCDPTRRLRENMTSLLEGAKKLVTRGTDLGARSPASTRPWTLPAAGSTTPSSTRRRDGRRRAPATGCGSPPTTPSSRSPAPPARASPRRSTRSPASSSPLSASAVPRRRGRPPASGARPGRRRAARVARHPAAAPRRPRLDARHRPRGQGDARASCSSTCPTTTPPRSPTTSRSTGWSSSPTCWCGSSTRRSTPTPRSTTATSRRWQSHKDVMLVVLNHIDTVPEGRRDAMLADVRRLLAADGLDGVPVLAHQRPRPDRHRHPARPRSPGGWPTRRWRAPAWRPTCAAAAERPGSSSPAPPPRRSSPRTGSPRSTTRFADAAGVPTVVDAVEKSTRLRANRATGWPRGRLALQAEARPAQAAPPRPRLGRQGADRHRADLDPRGRPRCSGPASTPRCGRVADEVSAGLTRPWATAVRTASVSRLPDLDDRLDAALAGTDLGVQRIPIWAGLVRVLQWLLILSALGGRGVAGRARGDGLPPAARAADPRRARASRCPR